MWSGCPHCTAQDLLLRHVQRSPKAFAGQRPGNAVRAAALRVYALDAAFPFDFEHKAKVQLERQSKLRVGIVGFGTFGQFLARRLVAAGHEVLATSRSPYDAAAASMGIAYYRDANDFCEEHPDVVVLATSILSTEAVLAGLPVQRLRRNTLFVDVLSVKLFPKRLMLALLPPEVDVLCTHPMFGPDSGAGSWAGLNLMFERVRIAQDPERLQRVANFLSFFEREGCRMVEMACEEHDRIAAGSQFITHTIGRVLGAMEPKPSAIDTRGYESLLSLVENTTHDSFELYYGLFLYNPNATEELERLEHAFDAVRQQLFRRLHDGVRAQIFSPAQPAAVLGAVPPRGPVIGLSPAASGSLPGAVASSSAANGNGSGRGRADRRGARGAEGGLGDAERALAQGGAVPGGVDRK